MTTPASVNGTPENLLEISGLAVSYRSRSGLVRAGEIVAVVGESGSGKSTTAHAVLGRGRAPWNC